MDLGLAGAAVVVAGGTTGMGRAAADCFAADGARVAVLARSRADLDETAAALTELGSPDAIGVATDLFDGASVDAAIAEIGERWGTPQRGRQRRRPDGRRPQELRDLHRRGLARGLRRADPRARCARSGPRCRTSGKAEWARIVNVSAMSTKRQSPPLIAYTAAKSALTSLTKNLAQTLAPEGILVNTVSPGTFASASFKAALAEMPGVDENDLHDIMRFIGEGFGHHVFLDRAADPAEIGPVIAFAASARNTYMTGANINVDGGSDFT